MTPSEFYDTVAREFPATWPTSPEWNWVNVHDGVAPKLEALRAMLDEYIRSPEVVVIVHSSPGIGSIMGKEAACSYISEHVLKHEIQAADPLFGSFVLVSSSGVATAWEKLAVQVVPSRPANDA
jgi:hypothetical protein